MRQIEVVAIRHVAFEDLGFFAPVLEERGYAIRYVEAPVDDLAAIDALDPALLVVLGGPIGADEENRYPFLSAELRLLERRLARNLPVLGVCLGAQLMARALAATIIRAPVKELGWAPLQLTADGEAGPLRHLAGEPVLHWHGDTFDLPDDAVLLASTPQCVNQAYGWGDAALGLQFHVEAGGPGLERWYVGHAAELAATPGIDLAALRRDGERYGLGTLGAGRTMLRAWLGGVGL